MALTNMKLSKQEAKAEATIDEGERPAYPYGLSISLDDDSMKKLKIGGDDLEVGDKVTITAKAQVTSKSGYESLLGGSDNSLCFQITDMEVSEASSLYDK